MAAKKNNKTKEDLGGDTTIEIMEEEPVKKKLIGTPYRLEGQEAASFIAALEPSEYDRLRSHGGWRLMQDRSVFVTISSHSNLVGMTKFDRGLNRSERISYNHNNKTVMVEEDE